MQIEPSRPFIETHRMISDYVPDRNNSSTAVNPQAEPSGLRIALQKHKQQVHK